MCGALVGYVSPANDNAGAVNRFEVPKMKNEYFPFGQVVSRASWVGKLPQVQENQRRGRNSRSSLTVNAVWAPPGAATAAAATELEPASSTMASNIKGEHRGNAGPALVCTETCLLYKATRLISAAIPGAQANHRNAMVKPTPNPFRTR